MLPRKIATSPNLSRYLKRGSYSTAAKDKAELMLNLEPRYLAPRRLKKPAREPFAKNLFLGKFDVEFLTFLEPQSGERNKEFFEWVKPLETYTRSIDSKVIDETGVIPREVHEQLRDMGVFRSRIPEDYGGLDLLESEFAHLVDTLAFASSLASSAVKHCVIPVDIIVKHCSVKQKLEFLTKIASGDLVPAVCITENSTDINVGSVNTKAYLSECETYWNITGEKICVENSLDANLLLVTALAVQGGELYTNENSLAVFLVDGNAEGVRKTRRTTLGQKGLTVCDVSFKDVKIPRENMIDKVGTGLEILKSALKPGKHHLGAQAVGLLKNFAQHLQEHVLRRKLFDNPMHEMESVQFAVTDVNCKLYAMESVLYFTTTIMDTYENQDTELERCIVESYCTRQCAESIYKGLRLIGAHSYLQEFPYERMYRDALALPLFDSYQLNTDAYLTMLGLQHAGKALCEAVNQIRNPLQFPKLVFQGYFKEILGRQEKLNLKLANYLHPSFQQCAAYLEETLTLLFKSVRLVLERHGANVVQQQMDVSRIGDMAVEIYVLTSVLARASRSYCIGLRNSEMEIHNSIYLTLETYFNVKRYHEDLVNGQNINGDWYKKELIEGIYKTKKFYAEHPLARNF